MKRLLMLVSVLGLFACGNPFVIQELQQQSTSQITDCDADRIEIIEHKINQENGSATWMALCEGRTYSCERSSANGPASCSEMESQMPE